MNRDEEEEYRRFNLYHFYKSKTIFEELKSIKIYGSDHIKCLFTLYDHGKLIREDQYGSYIMTTDKSTFLVSMIPIWCFSYLKLEKAGLVTDVKGVLSVYLLDKKIERIFTQEDALDIMYGMQEKHYYYILTKITDEDTVKEIIQYHCNFVYDEYTDIMSIV